MNRSPSLAAIASTSIWVGKRVTVSGWCVGPWIALAPGGAPRSKSDWLLTDQTTRLYVVGAIPHECPVNGRSSEPVTVDVFVAEDTVVMSLGRAAIPRRYLVRVAS